MATDTEHAYRKIQYLVKEKPELSSTVAAKLESLAEELQNLAISEETKTLTGFDKLQAGFAKFKKEIYEKNPELTNKLKTGQWPEFMVIACADSRVSPTAVLGLQPGDAFVVRNIANMVPEWEKDGSPSVGAALEYAVLHLKVKHIIIIGHRACGGIGALVKMTPDDGKYTTTFIEKWVEIGKPARATLHKRLPGAPVDHLHEKCEKESVNHSLSNLLTYPFLVDAVNEGKITLHGGYYDHIEGTFQKWDFGTDKKIGETVNFK